MTSSNATRARLYARLLIVAVFMILPSPAAGGLSSGQSEPVTLTVVIAGSGMGSVASNDPPGITCPTVCSAQFAAGTRLSLVAEADPGSKIDGWTPDCEGPGGPPAPGLSTCVVALDGNVTIQMTFSLKPSCVVPRTKGRTVSYAKSQINKSHCAVGDIAHAFSRKVKKGRVISQTPRAGRQLPNGTEVDLLVSKGIRLRITR